MTVMTGIMTLRNSRDLRARDVIRILFILFGYLIPAHSYICEIRKEKDPQDEWKWILPYTDLCQCTSVIMGGMNTRTPIRPFVPRYFENPLLSNDIHEIRNYYGLRCNKMKASTNAKTLSTLVTTQFRRRVSPVNTTTEKKAIQEKTTTGGSSSLSTSTQFRYRVSTTATEIESIEKTTIKTTEGVSSTSIKTSSAISFKNDATTGIITASKYATSAAKTTTDSTEGLSSSTQQTISRDISTTRTITAKEYVKSTPPEKTTTDLTTNAVSATQSWSDIPVCNDYLGMKNADIQDEYVTASSKRNDFHAYKARLYGESCWKANNDDQQPWIQADIGYQTEVTGIITQGDGGACGQHDWLTTLMVSTFFNRTDDNEVFIEDENGEHKIFNANTDRDRAGRSSDCTHYISDCCKTSYR